MVEKKFATVAGAESEVEASIAKADLDQQVPTCARKLHA